MIRVGHGYDVHKFSKDRKLILGGVEIEYDKGLLGHSDADVLVHAIIDSLLGAASKGDIGTLFPDDSDKYKDASSLDLLKKVSEILKSEGFYICNIDSTIVMQEPKVNLFIGDMRENIARVCSMDYNSVNIKATTEEGLSFTGKGEGVAAHAVSLISNFK